MGPPPLHRPLDEQMLFANDGFDRAGHRRTDAGWLAAQLANPDSALLPVWRNRNLVEQADSCRLRTLPAPLYAELATPGNPPVFLGEYDGRAWFAVDIGHIEEPEALPALAGPCAFVDLRRLLPILGQRGIDAAERIDANLMAYARAMIYWDRRHRYCGACGKPALSDSGGHRRRCVDENCAADHFPRTDTAMIVAVHDGNDNLLLGRSPHFVPGMRSILAGFQEPGESLEGTVSREILEEVGLHIADIAYRWSQPWPFPGSLMVGFTARATSFDITLDPNELEDAGWYTRAQVTAMTDPRAETRVPPPVSVSGLLIRAWLAGEF